jgi:hypothetical protein
MAHVYASAFDSATNTLYIGGNFTEVSTPVPNPLVFNSSTSAIQSFPMVDGGAVADYGSRWIGWMLHWWKL